MSSLKYHEGEIAVQKRVGVFDPSDLAGNGLGSELDERATKFLEAQPWAVIAGLDAENRIWTALLHGQPGFLRAEDSHTLTVHASLSTGDPLAESFRKENQIGMLVLDLRTRRRMRVNGHAVVLGNGQLRLTTSEVYGNCPKYIQRREIIAVAPLEQLTSVEVATLSPAHRNWIERADTFFIASLHADAGVDCSHRGGNPGFVRVVDDRHLIFADYSGNNMFQTLGNLSLDSRASLLFLDFENGNVLQLTGLAGIIWDESRLQGWPGAKRLIAFEAQEMIQTDSAFPLRWRLLDYSPANP